MPLPPFFNYPELKTEDLLLRRIKAEDISQLLPISYYDGRPATTEAEAVAMFQKIEQDYFNGAGFYAGRTRRISRDMVYPEFQRLGIGKKFRFFRFKRIKEDPRVEKIIVRTIPQAEKFYENIGFQKGYFEKDFWAPGFDLCEMELRIK